MMEPIQSLLAHGFSSKVVDQWGSGVNHVLLVGEAPGEHEDRTGIPFNERAPAGGTLHRLLRRGGWRAEDFRITNSVMQRPPKNWLTNAPWEHEAIQAFKPILEQQILDFSPQCIVALGDVALRALTGYSNGILSARGYVFQSDYGWVVPTYHPSFILQGNGGLSGVFIYDIAKALDIAKGGHERRPTAFVTHPSLDDMLQFERDYQPEHHALSYDIETPESADLDEEAVENDIENISYNIVRASLCFEAGYAISFPWQEPFVTVAKRMLASCGSKRGWNSRLFDDPRLEANGVIIGGRRYDLMDGWHHLQPTLPKGLAFVAPFYGYDGEPWKHLSHSQPEMYSALDAHVTQLIGDGIERDLRATGRWERYEDHVVEITSILQMMSRNGLPYSAEKAEEFRIELEALLADREQQLQSRVPEHIKPSKQKSGYKKTPKETAGLVQRQFTVWPDDLAKDEPHVLHADGRAVVTRWCVVAPFLPTSAKQVLALIKANGHKPGRNKDTGNDTTDKDTIKKLIARYWEAKRPVDFEAARTYKLTLECRQLKKVLGTYVYGWRPKADGRIHATAGFWGKMFRISWRNPNIAATIADKEEEYIAAGFRKSVCVTSPKVLLESDWKGMEAVLVGFFASDEEYMRIARLGVHAYMTALVLADQGKIPQSEVPDIHKWSEADILACFSSLKKRFKYAYDQNKHGVHLSNFLGKPPLMSMMFPESFPTTRSAADWQTFYFSTVAQKVKKWQQATLQQAWQEAKLVNPFSYQMPFWDVYDWNQRRHDTLLGLWERRGRVTMTKPQRAWIERLESRVAAGMGIEAAVRGVSWDLGDDAKSAISFLPRDTGAAMLKEVLLRLERKHQLASRGILLSSTHDSVLTEQHESELDQIALIVREEMEAAVPQLNNLVIGVEQKFGHAWSDAAMTAYVAQLPASTENIHLALKD